MSDNGETRLVTLEALKRVKWELMASDIAQRIIILGQLVKSLPDEHPLSERIVTDLVEPALDCLAKFCDSVEKKEEDEE